MKRVVFKPVMAADGDPFGDNFEMEDTDSIQDALDDTTDTLEDLQDSVEELDDNPQDPILDINNNIENHYIAECRRCHEIFISAVVESESAVSSINGECPVCHEETEQDLKWIVRSAADENEGELM